MKLLRHAIIPHKDRTCTFLYFFGVMTDMILFLEIDPICY